MRKILYSLLIIAFTQQLSAQNLDSTSASINNPQISLSGFVDIFYAYDFNRPPNHIRQYFLFNHNRHNQFNLNLGAIQLDVDGDQYRARLALMAGTYAQDNYADEEPLLKSVLEAYAGVALNSSRTLWLDAGIFESHIGFEYVHSDKNFTLTHSLVAENTPYFLSGARLTWEVNPQLTLAGLVTNGWQRIARPLFNQTPGLGTQVLYQSRSGIEFNWSTFLSNDFPDQEARRFIYNNFYVQSDLNQKLTFTAGFDIGLQQSAAASSEYDAWYVPTAILHYQINPEWAIAARMEAFHDQQEVIIIRPAGTGINLRGYSLNIDRKIGDAVSIRTEFRYFTNEEATFLRWNEDLVETSRSNLAWVTSLAVRIPEMRLSR
ncbi:MAG: porin [Cyclobacteriaceae bacterium]|nr:porin [Cyclobacteriaceae bacterium]MCH8515480.1 porin [Cyclobacteriaceae bacterium]